ncbi:unnamed protein product, partial [Thlaspi arvense]
DSRSPSPRREQQRRPQSRSRSRSMPRERSRSRSLPRARSRSRSLPRPISPSRGRGRSRSRSRGRSDIENPGTTLYVTGLSTRVTDKDLEAHFSKEGKVASCFLVMEPRTRESRGFAFVTMDSLKDAERCIKYLNQSVLEGRYITVERSRRKRPRTPTPGHYLGLKNSRDNDCLLFCDILLLWKKTEKAVAVEGGTTIVMIMDTVGHQDATIHLAMQGGHQDVTIHLVVGEVLEEIGLTLLMEEAQREGQREGINLVARDDLFSSLDK